MFANNYLIKSKFNKVIDLHDKLADKIKIVLQNKDCIINIYLSSQLDYIKLDEIV